MKAKVAGEGVYVHNQTYLTLEEFDKIIDGHHGSIHLVPCNCKSQKYFHDRKLNVCVNMNDGPNSAVDRGRQRAGRKILCAGGARCGRQGL